MSGEYGNYQQKLPENDKPDSTFSQKQPIERKASTNITSPFQVTRKPKADADPRIGSVMKQGHSETTSSAVRRPKGPGLKGRVKGAKPKVPGLNLNNIRKETRSGAAENEQPVPTDNKAMSRSRESTSSLALSALKGKEASSPRAGATMHPSLYNKHAAALSPSIAQVTSPTLESIEKMVDERKSVGHALETLGRTIRHESFTQLVTTQPADIKKSLNNINRLVRELEPLNEELNRQLGDIKSLAKKNPNQADKEFKAFIGSPGAKKYVQLSNDLFFNVSKLKQPVLSQLQNPGGSANQITESFEVMKKDLFSGSLKILQAPDKAFDEIVTKTQAYRTAMRTIHDRLMGPGEKGEDFRKLYHGESPANKNLLAELVTSFNGVQALEMKIDEAMSQFSNPSLNFDQKVKILRVMVESKDYQDLVNAIAKYSNVYEQLSKVHSSRTKTDGSPRSLGEAVGSLFARTNENGATENLQLLLSKPFQRVAIFKTTVNGAESAAKKAGNSEAHAELTALANTLDHKIKAMDHRRQHYQNVTSPNASLASQATNLLAGIQANSKAKASLVRPLVEGLMNTLLEARKEGSAPTQELKTQFDSLTKTPQVKELLKASKSFRQAHQAVLNQLNAPGGEPHQSDLTAQQAAIHIGRGNLNMIDVHQHSLQNLAVALGQEMRMLEGGTDTNAEQARANIMEFALKNLPGIPADLSDSEKAALVSGILTLAKSAELQNVKGADGLRPLIDDKFPATARLVEEQPLLPLEEVKVKITEAKRQALISSTRQLIDKMTLSDGAEQKELRDAFILGGNIMNWGSGSLKGVNIFEQFHTIYPLLKPLQQSNILRLVFDYLNANASLPNSVVDQDQLKGHIKQLLTTAESTGIIDDQMKSTLNNYVTSPSKEGDFLKMPPPSGKPVATLVEEAKNEVLGYRLNTRQPDQIFQDMASLYEDAFANISLSELDQHDGKNPNPQLEKIVNLSKQITNFVRHEILFGTGTSDSIIAKNHIEDVTAKMIQVAERAVDAHHYEVGGAIISALGGELSRLTDEVKLSDGAKAALQRLNTLYDPTGGSRNLRAAIASASEAGGVVFPPLPVVFGQLTAATVGNATIKGDERNSIEVNSERLLIYAKAKQSISNFVGGSHEQRTKGTSDKDLLANTFEQLAQQDAKWGEETKKSDIQYARSLEIKPRGGK